MGQADTTFALYARSTPPLPFLDRVGSPAASKALGKSVVDRFSDPAAARFHTEEMSFLAADPQPFSSRRAEKMARNTTPPPFPTEYASWD